MTGLFFDIFYYPALLVTGKYMKQVSLYRIR
jgi:hypothetical protein